jgi:hypothetical protein
MFHYLHLRDGAKQMMIQLGLSTVQKLLDLMALALR